MSEKWPWYTESGGIFMPIEDALKNGVLGCLVFLLFGLPLMLVWALYVLLKALGGGGTAISRGEWRTAWKHLRLIVIPSTILAGAAVFGCLSYFLLSFYLTK